MTPPTSVGNREYDCLAACARALGDVSAVGSGMVGSITLCSMAFVFDASLLYGGA
jgi:hypothetical protein